MGYGISVMAIRLPLCMLIGICSRVLTGSDVKYVMHASLTGYTCTNNQVLFDVTSLRSAVSCAAKCTETTTCYGVFHRRQDMRCIGCMEEFIVSTETPMLNGTRYYRRQTYKIIDTKLSWNESKQRCGDIGGHLAYIKSQEEQLFIEAYITHDIRKTLWLGGRNSGNTGEFFWQDGDPVSDGFTNWRDGHPLTICSSEQCMILFYVNQEWVWQDMPCGPSGVNRYGLCEFD
ncbi:ladderlectin-like [Ruditapes philippinarum]|uniref:ladderlectin-like n=1 Tax=Ruditapes philippinarum TaxID=129788 RepID=UPI00295ADD8A|nr:ladderlectin-like [Ruditapes philippinarum]